MFKSIGGFFRDIVAPIGLSFLGPAGPVIAAAYSGIKTGLQTGSPLAGIGSAGLSLGLSSAFRGLTAGKEAPASFVSPFETTGAMVDAGGIGSTAGGPSFLADATDMGTKGLMTGFTPPTPTPPTFSDRLGAKFSNLGTNIQDFGKVSIYSSTSFYKTFIT